MPQAGDVFRYRDYEFEDGSKRDKLFVVLNTADLERPCLVLKTTSRPERYQGCVKGCNKNRKCFYAPAAWQPSFKFDTYIQLPQIIEFPAGRLLQEAFARRVEYVPPLTPDALARLKDCLATFKDDISSAHWGLIFRAKN